MIHQTRVRIESRGGEVRHAIEKRGEIPVISRTRVNYDLKVPRGKREEAERAVVTHETSCPTAQSVKGAIPIEITADIVEE